MLWITLAVFAQFLNAASIVVDKYVIARSGALGRPVAYAFYVSALSAVVLVMVPLGLVGLPSVAVLGMSLLVAITYILSILFLYSALRLTNPSDVVPVTGAVAALATFSLTQVLISSDVPFSFLLPFGLLVVGTAFISHFRFTVRSFVFAALAGLFFGLSAVCIKILFSQAPFTDAFFWSRMANVFGALLLLLVPGNRTAIFAGAVQSSAGHKWLVVGNKTLAGASFMLTLVAIKLGSVSIVGAMAGLQFVFLLSFAYLFGRYVPTIFHGEIHPHKFPHKLYGTIMIVVGLGILYAYAT